jgi:hypothetical protein
MAASGVEAMVAREEATAKGLGQYRLGGVPMSEETAVAVAGPPPEN